MVLLTNNSKDYIRNLFVWTFILLSPSHWNGMSSSLFVHANDNGIGLTPPMGWNSWYSFACTADMHESLIRETAHLLMDLGLQKVGYTYINLDDCWQISRDAQTNVIQADPTMFPSGIPALRDYIHALGDFQLGLYSDAGNYTCQGRPGSLGMEEVDAQTYKEWRIGYLKYDNCFSTQSTVRERYQAMHTALNRTGHAIFFSMCEWGIDHPATWAAPIGNSWRTTVDIRSNWKSITKILDQNDKWHDYAGPTLGWNDPDMLQVGNGDLTLAEQKSHFTLWCLMKAPLLISADLRSISSESLEILTNMEIIALNQDPLGVQGYKRTTSLEGGDTAGLEVWAGPLSDNNVAVVLFNRSEEPANITAFWQDIGIESDDTQMIVRDLWAHEGLGVHTASVTASVDPHGVVAYRLKPVLKSGETLSKS